MKTSRVHTHGCPAFVPVALFGWLAILQRMQEEGGEDELLPEEARSWIEARRASCVTRLEALPGGAGARRYVRVRLADGTSLIWMHARGEDPELLPPGLRNPSTELPFVAVTELLARAGLPVPELFGVAHEQQWVLLEDLGDQHLCDLPHSERLVRQREAVDLLARVHSLPHDNSLPFSRVFDEEWIRFELNHFLAHGIPGPLRGRLASALETLIRDIAALPRTLCLRDFQSQNLMIDARGHLRILDYQDALLAPPELDLAALLYDSYVELSDEERTQLLTHYASHRGEGADPDRLTLLVVQRKCKDYARFRYLSRVKHDARFAPYERTAREAVLSTLPSLPAGLHGLGTLLVEALNSNPA